MKHRVGASEWYTRKISCNAKTQVMFWLVHIFYVKKSVKVSLADACGDIASSIQSRAARTHTTALDGTDFARARSSETALGFFMT